MKIVGAIGGDQGTKQGKLTLQVKIDFFRTISLIYCENYRVSSLLMPYSGFGLVKVLFAYTFLAHLVVLYRF